MARAQSKLSALPRAAVFGSEEPNRAPLIGAIVTLCSKRKSLRVSVEATPKGIKVGTLEETSVAWLKVLRDLQPEIAASDLYRGRGFLLSQAATSSMGAPLFIISAGLGLVPSNAIIPAYALTVVSGGPDYIGNRVSGTFDAGTWFQHMLRGPFSWTFEDLLSQSAGPVLVALTRAYAGLVANSLDRLSHHYKSRLRLFGGAIETALPADLRPQIMPYDARLDTLIPGTRGDFAQRALFDFVQLIAASNPSADAAEHREAVLGRLVGLAKPTRPTRMRRTDVEILELVRTQAATNEPLSLRVLREKFGIACEQDRFRRLVTSNILPKSI